MMASHWASKITVTAGVLSAVYSPLQPMVQIPVKVGSYKESISEFETLQLKYEFDENHNRLENLISSYTSSSFRHSVTKYDNEQEYYVTVYDNDKSIEDNFDIVENLNNETFEKDYPFIFLVGG